MGHKTGRPEWFKFWRRNRAQLDIEQLSMESRGKVFTNMMRYFDQDAELIEMDSIEALAFNVLKVNVDDSIAEYAETSRQNRENVNKRWQYERIRSNTTDTKIEDRSQKTEDRSQKESIADKPQRSRFIPPTVAEVEAYCQERNNGLDAQRFVDFYTANGWKVGKNTMKDWKAAVRTWENRDQDKKQIDNDWMKEKVVGWNGNR